MKIETNTAADIDADSTAFHACADSVKEVMRSTILQLADHYGDAGLDARCVAMIVAECAVQTAAVLTLVADAGITELPDSWTAIYTAETGKPGRIRVEATTSECIVPEGQVH